MSLFLKFFGEKAALDEGNNDSLVWEMCVQHVFVVRFHFIVEQATLGSFFQKKGAAPADKRNAFYTSRGIKRATMEDF